MAIFDIRIALKISNISCKNHYKVTPSLYVWGWVAVSVERHLSGISGEITTEEASSCSTANWRFKDDLRRKMSFRRETNL